MSDLLLGNPVVGEDISVNYDFGSHSVAQLTLNSCHSPCLSVVNAAVPGYATIPGLDNENFE